MSDLGQFEEHVLPQGPPVYFNSLQHSYWQGVKPKKDGTFSGTGRLTGVTTVAKAYDTNADPLITWGSKLTAQGVCDLLSPCEDEELRSMLNDGEQLHRELVAANLDWRSIRNQAATRGTAVHEVIFAAFGRREEPSLGDLTDEERGYGQAVFRFWGDHDPTPIATEQVVHMPERGIAGRFDLLCELDGVPALIDAKTSKGAYLSHHVQLAGYREGCEASGFAVPERLLVLLLRPDGSYELVEGAATDEDWDAACVAYEASKRVQKRDRDQRKSARIEAESLANDVVAA